MKPQRPEHEIDSLVRAYLRRQGETVDPAAMLRRVRAAQPQVARPSRNWGRALLGLSAAAAVLLIIFVGQYFGPTPARASVSPEAIVLQTKKVHEAVIDRCYLVQFIPEPTGPLSRLPRLAQKWEGRLWTRGDRFFFHPGEEDSSSWVFGCDHAARVWLVHGHRHAVRFAQKDLPSELALLCDACSMDVGTILDDLLARHHLTHERIRGDSPIDRIRAELRPQERPRGLRSAVLEIDARTRVLRRLELHRTGRKGEPLVTVHAKLIDTTPQPDALYTAEGHLPKGARVFSLRLRPLQKLLFRKFMHKK